MRFTRPGAWKARFAAPNRLACSSSRGSIAIMGPPRMRVLDFLSRVQPEAEPPCASIPWPKFPRGTIALGIRKAVVRRTRRLEGDCVLFLRAGIGPRRPAYPNSQIRKHIARECKLDPFIQRRPHQRAPAIRHRPGKELVCLRSIWRPHHAQVFTREALTRFHLRPCDAVAAISQPVARRTLRHHIADLGRQQNAIALLHTQQWMRGIQQALWSIATVFDQIVEHQTGSIQVRTPLECERAAKSRRP